MILREISDTSIIVSLLNRSYKWRANIKQKLADIYYHSRTYRLLNDFWEKIKICFRYCFIARITETKQATPVLTMGLDDSRSVQYSVSFYKRWKNKIAYCLRTSLTTALTKDAKELLNSSPLPIISMSLIVAIGVNVVLAYIFQRKIGLYSWLIRGLLFFAAASGLFCKVDWPNVRSSSVFLRRMRRIRDAR